MPPNDSPAAANCYTKVLQGWYKLDRVIGLGSLSMVYHAHDVRNGVPVAVKAIRKPHHPCSPKAAAAVRRSVDREVATLRRLQGHPHVVCLLDVLASRSTVYLVLELARDGSLLSALDDDRSRYDEPAVHRLFAQLASAFTHAQARGVFHRDIKLENLLIKECGDERRKTIGIF